MRQVLLHMFPEIAVDWVQMVARLRHRHDVVLGVAVPRLAAHREICRGWILSVEGIDRTVT